MAKIKVIDVSKYQGSIDWSKVKKAGVKGAILRVGYRGYGSAGNIAADPTFAANIKGATAAGIPVGVYFFSQAVNAAEARAEAAYTLAAVKGYKLGYPVYIDTEYANSTKTGRADKLTKAQRTAVVKAFCEEVEAAGYFAGIYASTSWFNSMLIDSELDAYTHWVAHYGVLKPTYKGTYAMWQHSSTGKVNGITGNVDMNWAYVDFPAAMEKHGLNGYAEPKLTTYKIGPMTEGDAKQVKALADKLALRCVEV